MLASESEPKNQLLSADRIIISQPWGGLGDNLQFSTLPELFHQVGIPTYVSTQNAYRNAEIQELVWKMNPYISGFSDDPPNAGAIRNAYLPFSNKLAFIERIEAAHDLKPANRFPKVYYEPQQIKGVQDLILVDLGSVSVRSSHKDLTQFLRTISAEYEPDKERYREVRFASVVSPQQKLRFPELQTHDVANIFEYCDALYSCKAFLTVHSGAQSLAVALRHKRPDMGIYCCCTVNQYNGKGYIYDNVRYHIVDHENSALHQLVNHPKRLARNAARQILGRGLTWPL